MKEINGDEYGIECRINCQPESKISAADKMGRKKMEPTMKKIFFRERYGISQNNLDFFYKNTMGRSVKKKPKGSVIPYAA